MGCETWWAQEAGEVLMTKEDRQVLEDVVQRRTLGMEFSCGAFMCPLRESLLSLLSAYTISVKHP
mgnify:CR=1 FL=1